VLKSYDYAASYSEEKPCMGGVGSKPAFQLLVSMYPDVVVKRSYTIYAGHVGFSVHAINRTAMACALWKLHKEYYWIDGNEAEIMKRETHEVDV